MLKDITLGQYFPGNSVIHRLDYRIHSVFIKHHYFIGYFKTCKKEILFMANYVLSCCSTADLTKEHFERRNLSYICFHYAIDGEEYIDDLEEHPAILTTQIAPDKFMSKEFLHVQCFDITVKKDKTWYSYYVLRGSHTYNSAEMARLIQGTIEDCKEQGIETATPDEIAKMQSLWENRGK